MLSERAGTDIYIVLALSRIGHGLGQTEGLGDGNTGVARFARSVDSSDQFITWRASVDT